MPDINAVLVSLIGPLLRLGLFFGGLLLVIYALRSAIRTFVLPRSATDPITRRVFTLTRGIFERRARRLTTYRERDQLMAFFAPVGLMLLLPTWLAIVLVGYAAMFWATGIQPVYRAFVLSGSSLFTLGFERAEGYGIEVMIFTESTIGLIMVALLIAYLPTMYGAFARREQAVTLLEVRAGSPPTALEMIRRYNRLGRLDQLHEIWVPWEEWFAEIEESHTSLAALVFFRSPQKDHSWVTAAGAILDAAALMDAVVDLPRDLRARLCLRAGYIALRRISDRFDVEYNGDATFPEDPIGIQREAFDAAYEMLAFEGIPLKADIDQAWQDFAGWRVNYDAVLYALAQMTMAPPAPWSIDLMPTDSSPPQG